MAYHGVVMEQGDTTLKCFDSVRRGSCSEISSNLRLVPIMGIDLVVDDKEVSASVVSPF